MAMLRCPSRCWTTCGGTRALRSRVADVWRRPWSLIGRTPASRASFRNSRLRSLTWSGSPRVSPAPPVDRLFGEGEPQVAVGGAVAELELGLVAPVSPEERDGLGAEVDGPGHLVLHRAEAGRPAARAELALDLHARVRQVRGFGPPEPGQLVPARAGVERGGGERPPLRGRDPGRRGER